MIGAVVPAAGRSTRMGRAKLLLKLGGEALLARVVTALTEGGANRVVVVAPPASAAEGPAIATLAKESGAEVVVPPAQPAEMRDSIELGLWALALPLPPDRVLIAPGDCPGITAEIVASLLAEAAVQADSIVVPSCDGRRGHPLVLPWDVAAVAPTLPPGLGLNALVARYEERVIEVRCSAPGPDDLDTSDDLRRWEALLGECNPAQSRIAALPTLRLRVRLFAAAKERAGRSEIDVELPVDATVTRLRTALGSEWPALAPLLPTALIAVDEEYAGDQTVIRPGAGSR